MHTLGQSINDDPCRIHPARRPRKICDKIRCSLFKFPNRNFQWIRFDVGSLMLDFDFPTSQAPPYLPGHISLHAWKPIVEWEIHIHLCCSEMNREPQLVRLLHQNPAYMTQIKNPHPLVKGQ